MQLSKTKSSFSWFSRCRPSLGAYFVDGATIAEDEVDVTLDEAVFEVMATSVVIQSVLVAKECALIERCDVGRHSQCYSLASYSSRWWPWCRILHHPCHSPLVYISL